MTTRTHFNRVDTWTPDGESIVEHAAGVEDYQRWPQHTDHVAAGRPRDRGQPAPTPGVC